MLKTVLQIVPRVPGGIDGVGDYALTLAAKLRDKFQCATVFATPDASRVTNVRGFEVRPLDRVRDQVRGFDHILLHYVNYGYQKRGIPFGLLSILRRMRRQHRCKLVTIFHELYASGPPWRSEYWLQPLQIYLAKSIARLSDECIVSSENFLRELQRLVPNAPAHLHPVPSGLEEPSLSVGQIAERDPHRWIIVGGTVLAQRSLRSFCENLRRIPDSVAPRMLIVVGGHKHTVTRSLLADLEIDLSYHPEIEASAASEILRTCSFAWFDYFHRSDVEFSMILKSSAFAAACAHGIIPVFPHRGSPVSINDDPLPGPFFIEPNACDIPHGPQRPRVAANIYEWYHRHASSDSLVNGVANVLALSQANR